jgi:hypothetical protein
MRSHPPTASLLTAAAVMAVALSASLVACGPKNVTDAEKRSDVAWLDTKGTPDAIAALGRLADKNDKAARAIEKRAPYDPNAYAAAWAAVVRGAPWGTALFRAALADPVRAESAAAAMDRGDGHMTPFLSDLEAALVRLGASMQNAAISTSLASAGPAAHDAVTRRLADAATRGAMCRGLGSPEASPDARKCLMQAPAQSRDNSYCLDAALKLAGDDDEALSWLAGVAEPGLLGAAGKSELLTCGRLHLAWSKALVTRPASTHAALIVPLAHALKRCPLEMDGVLADSLTRNPASADVIVGAIDPYGSYGANLKATCKALEAVRNFRGISAVTRERANDAVARSCKMK